jgi:hypothetical protein
MQSYDANAQAEPSPMAAQTAPGALSAGGTSPSHLWLWALSAALLAGLVTCLGGEAAYDWFKPIFPLPANWAKLGPYEKPDVLSALLRKARPGAEAKNSALAYGLLGATLAGGLGLAGGLARRSIPAALAAALVGLVGGAATGAGLSVPVTHAFYKHLDPESGLMLALLIRGGIWAPIGAVAGLAFGLGLGGPRTIARALIGGLAGGILGTMAFEIANAFAFPLSRLNAPIPDERFPRLLAILCVAVSTALAVAVGVRERERKRKPPRLPELP